LESFKEEYNLDVQIRKNFFSLKDQLYDKILNHSSFETIPDWAKDDMVEGDAYDISDLCMEIGIAYSEVNEIKDPTNAVKWLDIAMSMDEGRTNKNYGKALFIIAQYYKEGLGELEQSIEKYEQYIRMSKGKGYNYAIGELAQLELDKGNEGEAIKLRNEAIEKGVEEKYLFNIAGSENNGDSLSDKNSFNAVDVIRDVASITSDINNTIKNTSNIVQGIGETVSQVDRFKDYASTSKDRHASMKKKGVYDAAAAANESETNYIVNRSANAKQQYEAMKSEKKYNRKLDKMSKGNGKKK
jgi:tetratricopeptide (TPR) repeat protein